MSAAEDLMARVRGIAYRAQHDKNPAPAQVRGDEARAETPGGSAQDAGHENYYVDRWGVGHWNDGTPDMTNIPQ